jgi:membrane protein implicated in regulation of membrane protease activity
MGILPYIFAAITLAGVLYFLYSLFFGGNSVDELDLDLGDGSGEGNFTLLVGAAFASIFGAVGLLGTLSGWNFLLTLVIAIALGLGIGRAVLALLRFVMRQQAAQVNRRDELIGSSGRVTIETAAGMISEAMIDGSTIDKHAIKEINDAALHRGDVVEVVDVDTSVLYVKKKRQ